MGSHSLLQDLSYPGIEPRSPALQADSLPSEPPGMPPGLKKCCWVQKSHLMAVGWEKLHGCWFFCLFVFCSSGCWPRSTGQLSSSEAAGCNLLSWLHKAGGQAIDKSTHHPSMGIRFLCLPVHLGVHIWSCSMGVLG